MALWLVGTGLRWWVRGRGGWGIRCSVVQRGCWTRVEAVGWLLVVRVASAFVSAGSCAIAWRALGRLAAYGWALQERSRIELVFGRVQGRMGVIWVSACGVWDGSGVGVRWCCGRGCRIACSGWWCFLLRVGCGGSVMVVWWVEEEFSNTLRNIGTNRALRNIGRGAVALGLALDALSILTAPPCEKGRAIGGAIGGAVGSIVGAAVGSAIAPGVGTIIGGAVGGFLGGLVGDWLGSRFRPEGCDCP
jgi:hypothetical protein